MNIEMHDIEENNEKAISRGIMAVPTMIIYDGEKEITRLMGIQSKENIAYLMSQSLEIE